MKWGKLPRGTYRFDSEVNGRSQNVRCRYTAALTAEAGTPAADTRGLNGIDAFDAGFVTVTCAGTRVWTANIHDAHGR